MPNSEIRIGKVSSVNCKSGMMRVTYHDKDDSVTCEYPMITNNDEYRMPAIGQQVLVAHLSNGSSRGVIIGTVWNGKYEPYEAGEELYRKELSRKKDAAYIRYSDITGEYLIKVANLHLNGVNKTTLDGPKLEISANISLTLESEAVHLNMEELTVTGGKSREVNVDIMTDLNIRQAENSLDAAVKEAVLEFLEGMEITSGTDVVVNAADKIEVSSAELKLSGTEYTEIKSSAELRLSDGRYSITLSEIMERLGEAQE